MDFGDLLRVTRVVLLLKINLLLIIRSLVMKTNIILWFPSRWVLTYAKNRRTCFGDLLWVTGVVLNMGTKYSKLWNMIDLSFNDNFLQIFADAVPLRICLCKNCYFWCLLIQFDFILISDTSVSILWTMNFLFLKCLVPIAYTQIDGRGLILNLSIHSQFQEEL